MLPKNMVSSREKNSKKRPSLLTESLSDFIIGNNTNTSTVENETTEPQTGFLANDFGRCIVGENDTSHDKVIQRNFADRITKEVDNAVTSVEN